MCLCIGVTWGLSLRVKGLAAGGCSGPCEQSPRLWWSPAAHQGQGVTPQAPKAGVWMPQVLLCHPAGRSPSQRSPAGVVRLSDVLLAIQPSLLYFRLLLPIQLLSAS